jgi:ribonuclease HI
MKVNCDGAVAGQGHISACGGAICNCEREFLLGFVENIVTCTITSAELWAIR